MVLKQSKLNILFYCWSEKRVMLTYIKMFMNQFSENLVWWFDTTELCILILISVTLTLIQGLRDARNSAPIVLWSL